MSIAFFFLEVPPNGLVIFVGTVSDDEGKDKKLSIHFEPFKPINTSLYLCDNKFHTEVTKFKLFSSHPCLFKVVFYFCGMSHESIAG